jgi:hypothetical protein
MFLSTYAHIIYALNKRSLEASDNTPADLSELANFKFSDEIDDDMARKVAEKIIADTSQIETPVEVAAAATETLAEREIASQTKPAPLGVIAHDKVPSEIAPSQEEETKRPT